MYTESEVLDFVKEEDVRFVRLAFFDITGRQKNISIMAGELERAFRDGIAFDASAVKGFENPNRSDLFLHPEPATLAVLPWRPMTGKVIRLFCGIKYPDGTPYEYDSRYILQKAVEKAKAGFKTIGFDIQKEKVQMVNEGHNYIGDVVDSELAELVHSGMLQATSDFSFIKDVDFIAICVPTPLDAHQQP